MNRLGKIVSTIAHLIIALVTGLLGFGDTPWLLKKVREEDEQTGRLI